MCVLRELVAVCVCDSSESVSALHREQMWSGPQGPLSARFYKAKTLSAYGRKIPWDTQKGKGGGEGERE